LSAAGTTLMTVVSRSCAERFAVPMGMIT